MLHGCCLHGNLGSEARLLSCNGKAKCFKSTMCLVIHLREVNPIIEQHYPCNDAQRHEAEHGLPVVRFFGVMLSLIQEYAKPKSESSTPGI